jgi:hypothetical protein
LIAAFCDEPLISVQVNPPPMTFSVILLFPPTTFIPVPDDRAAAAGVVPPMIVCPEEREIADRFAVLVAPETTMLFELNEAVPVPPVGTENGVIPA